MTTPTADQYFADLRRRREEALQALDAALTKPESVPLAKLPAVGTLIRLVARVYYLAEVQARQHAFDRAQADELAALSQTLTDQLKLIQDMRLTTANSQATMERLRAQMIYLPESINTLFSEVRQEIKQSGKSPNGEH